MTIVDPEQRTKRRLPGISRGQKSTCDRTANSATGLKIARGYDQARSEAMHRAGTNTRQGVAYRGEFAKIEAIGDGIARELGASAGVNDQVVERRPALSRLMLAAVYRVDRLWTTDRG
jgi:hypothetical protein